MMQKPSDETLIAYLDGELDGAERLAVIAGAGRATTASARAGQRLDDSARLICARPMTRCCASPCPSG